MNGVVLLTVKEVAARSSLSERTIRSLIARGTLPVVRPAGLRAVRIQEEVFERVLLGRSGNEAARRRH